MKLSEADLSDKTGLYSIGGVDFPVLMTVKHGTLMVRSYYGDDFDFELTPNGQNRFLLQGSFPSSSSPPAPADRSSGTSAKGKISASGTKSRSR